jgi:3-methyladenine DNA glycosylase AlkD
LTADDVAARIAALPQRSTEPLRALRRVLSKELRDASGAEVLDLAITLTQRGIECRFIASELVARHRGAMRLVDAPSLRRLGAGIDSWSSVDIFATYLAGPAWRDGQFDTGTIARWAKSPDRWWRRAALVSTIAISRTGESTQTLAICAMLAADRDDMVVKAMSWALRELSKRDPAAVAKFLDDQDLAPRVVREVRTKLATGRKR